MAHGAIGGVVRQVERLFTTGAVTGLSEGQLLDRFVNRRDEAAFEALVARHGPMVLTVCRRWLRDPNDIDDALALAVGEWLDEFERAQLALRLSPRLREVHGD